MKPSTPSKALITAAMLLGAATIVAPAAAQSQIVKGKRDQGDFVRGYDNTKGKRIVPPKTEQEAIARKRTTARGVVELQLPEDRMVNLVAVRNPDGVVVGYQHQAEAAPSPQAAQGEVK
ncbi:MAG: hypothetical protein ABIP44_12935 [Pseudoxanthomonas sp.]